MTVALIAAVASNRVIGAGGGLPWHISADLKHFKKLTMGKPVVMGRKTFESIGQPLKGRANIVVSGNPDYQPEGVTVVPSVADALKLAQTIAGANEDDEVMVIGGAQIYQDALVRADRLYLTEVDAEYEGDVFFPELADGQWREVAREDHAAADDSPAYSFVVLERT